LSGSESVCLYIISALEIQIVRFIDIGVIC